jgi:hypothetical protein
VSLDPSLAAPPGSGQPASIPADARPRDVSLIRVEVLPLQQGDRLIVHVDGSAGMSAGGAEAAGQRIRALLALDDLPFDVPVLVVSPGIRVQVARPS